MAASGSFYQSFKNDWYRVVVEWAETDIDEKNNRSKIAVKVYVKSMGSNHTIKATAAKVTKITINGVTYPDITHVGLNLSGNGSVLMAEKTSDYITHEEDGTKIVAITVVQGIRAVLDGTTITNVTANGTVNLSQIARSSQITSLTNVITLSQAPGTPVSVTWTPALATYTYKLEFSCGGKTVSTDIIAPNTTSSYTYSAMKLSLEDWAPYINDLLTNCSVKLYTYDGATLLGTSAVKNINVVMPNNDLTKPIPSISVIDTSSVTKYGFLKDYSKLKIQISTDIKYNTQNKVTYTITELLINGERVISPTNNYQFTPNTYGGINITVGVKDSRGLTNSTSTTINVENYHVPNITNFSAFRCISSTNKKPDVQGEYVAFTGDISIAPVIASYTSAPVKVRLWATLRGTLFNPSSMLAFYEAPLTTSLFRFGDDIIPINANPNESFTYYVIVDDGITSAIQKIAYVDSTFSLLEFHEDGNGFSIGKVCKTPGVVDAGIPIISTLKDGMGFSHFREDTDKKVFFGIGSEGLRRGIWDKTINDWMIGLSETNDLYLKGSNLYYVSKSADKIVKLVYESGDSFKLEGHREIFTGTTTNGGMDIHFFIPLSKPCLANSFNLEGTIVVRNTEANQYIPDGYGINLSSPSGFTIVNKWIEENGLAVLLRWTAVPTNMVNNIPISVTPHNDTGLTITFT